MNQTDKQALFQDTMAPERQKAPVDPLDVRSDPRIGTDLAAELYATDFSGALLGRTRDLAIGGACIATPSPFSVKSVRSVVLDLPAQRVMFDAIGCWQREDPSQGVVLTGVQFENPQPEQLDLVWDHILDSGKRLARFLYEQTALHELGLEEAMGLAQVTRYRSLNPGDLIYRQGQQGEDSDSIFLIIEGSVTLQVRIRNACEKPLTQLRVGDLFGGLPLLADLPHTESAVADTRVGLLELDGAALRHLRSTKPWLGHRLGVALLRVHAQRIGKILGLTSDHL